MVTRNGTVLDAYARYTCEPGYIMSVSDNYIEMTCSAQRGILQYGAWLPIRWDVNCRSMYNYKQENINTWHTCKIYDNVIEVVYLRSVLTNICFWRNSRVFTSEFLKNLENCFLGTIWILITVVNLQLHYYFKLFMLIM